MRVAINAVAVDAGGSETYLLRVLKALCAMSVDHEFLIILTSRQRSFPASLPEVVGEAAVLVDPLRVSSVADDIKRPAENASALRERSLARAKLFPWEAAARVTMEVLGAAPGF
jgi:hypothetical protein